MKRHVAWNLSGTIVTMIVTLVSVPLFLHVYGAERYGILATVWAVLGYFSVFDFGMGQAVINALAKTSEGETDEARSIWWTAVLLNLGIGAALGAVVVGAFLVFGSYVSAGSLARELTESLPYIVLMIPFSLIYPILVGDFDARQLFRTANLNQMLGTVLFQALPLLAALYFDATLPVAIAASLLGRAIVCATLFVQSIARHRYWPPQFEAQRARRLTRFGGWFALSSSAGGALDTGDRLIIATLLGGAPAAWYAISHSAVTRIRTLPTATMRTLFPRISASGADSGSEVEVSFRALSLILVPAACMGMFLIDPIFRIWVGTEIAAHATPLAQIMLAGLFANSLAFMPLVALMAGGQAKRAALILIGQVPVYLGLMWLTITHYGIEGAAVVWSLRLYVDWLLLVGAAGMWRIFLRDGLLQSLLPVTCAVVALTMPGDYFRQAGIGALLLIAWAVTDTLTARAIGNRPDLLTLAKALARTVKPARV